jgi:hypothetical protein
MGVGLLKAHLEKQERSNVETILRVNKIPMEYQGLGALSARQT